MGIKSIVTAQYKSIVNNASKYGRSIRTPREGWLCTARNALGMSAVQLGKRMGVTRSSISKTEKDELTGSVTIKRMKAISEAMECRFVYAIIPEREIDDILKSRARQKATRLVEEASKHMALEAQSLSHEQMEFEIDRLQQEMLKNMPADFWNDGI